MPPLPNQAQIIKYEHPAPIFKIVASCMKHMPL